ncbi:hypothetical protein C8J56DRAFT_72449 [Mycena floridula]|nr:hypothetical protein C8J56DRAFT_72449 [Mycena floridula]
MVITDHIWYKLQDDDEDVCIELDDRARKMITNGACHIRGIIKDRLHPIIAPHFGFHSRDKPSIESKNKEIYENLMYQNGFLYKDTKARTGYMRNAIIKDGLQEVFFKTTERQGVRYESYFSPISSATVAIILTTIDFCLEEWSTGKFVQGTIHEDSMKVKYDRYHDLFLDWSYCDGDRKDQIEVKCYLQHLHDDLRCYTGATMHCEVGRLSTVPQAKARAEIASLNDASDDESSDDGDMPVTAPPAPVDMLPTDS